MSGTGPSRPKRGRIEARRGRIEAPREVFAEIRPVSTMVGVEGLYHPDMLVESRADALVADELARGQ